MLGADPGRLLTVVPRRLCFHQLAHCHLFCSVRLPVAPGRSCSQSETALPIDLRAGCLTLIVYCLRKVSPQEAEPPDRQELLDDLENGISGNRLPNSRGKYQAFAVLARDFYLERGLAPRCKKC
jgi:hypothetical protein